MKATPETGEEAGEAPLLQVEEKPTPFPFYHGILASVQDAAPCGGHAYFLVEPPTPESAHRGPLIPFDPVHPLAEPL